MQYFTNNKILRLFGLNVYLCLVILRYSEQVIASVENKSYTSILPNSIFIGYSKYNPLFNKIDGSDCKDCNYISYANDNEDVKLVDQKEDSNFGRWLSTFSLHELHTATEKHEFSFKYFFENRFSYIHINQELSLLEVKTKNTYVEKLNFQILFYERLLRLSAFFSSHQFYILTGIGITTYMYERKTYLDAIGSIGIGWITYISENIYFETEINIIPFANPVVKKEDYSISGVGSITLGLGYKYL